MGPSTLVTPNSRTKPVTYSLVAFTNLLCASHQDTSHSRQHAQNLTPLRLFKPMLGLPTDSPHVRSMFKYPVTAHVNCPSHAPSMPQVARLNASGPISFVRPKDNLQGAPPSSLLSAFVAKIPMRPPMSLLTNPSTCPRRTS